MQSAMPAIMSITNGITPRIMSAVLIPSSGGAVPLTKNMA